uniref:Uncharacterized protein n=1 Tax=viral metagenome TaxID=1070528 RepID=A0A6C0BMD4_9ZZZZ
MYIPHWDMYCITQSIDCPLSSHLTGLAPLKHDSH